MTLFSCTLPSNSTCWILMSIPFVNFPSSSFTEGTNDSLLPHYGTSLSLGTPLSLSQLMPAQHHRESVYSHTPSTQQLYHNWQCVSEMSNRITILYQQALQENTELRTKVWDLEAQLTTTTQQGQHFFKGFGNTYVFFFSIFIWP